MVRVVLPDVTRYLRRRTDPDTADDVVSDVLLVMWRRFDEVEQLPADVRVPWCLGVARGCLANARRSADRRRGLWLRLVAAPETRAAAFGLRDSTGSEGPAPDTDEALTAAIDQLRDVDREVLH